MNELTQGQKIVLREHLSAYPDNASFDEICDMLAHGNDEVEVWVYFEKWKTKVFIDHITTLANNIDKVIIEMKEHGNDGCRVPRAR